MMAKPKDWPKGKQWVDPDTLVTLRRSAGPVRRGPTRKPGRKRPGTPAPLHANYNLGVYVQELPERVPAAVEALDQKLCGGGLAEAKPGGAVQQYPAGSAFCAS